MQPVTFLVFILGFHFSYSINNLLNNSGVDSISESLSLNGNKKENLSQPNEIIQPIPPPPCTCAIFLSGQVIKGKPPQGNPAILHELEDQVVCSNIGVKQCTNKCLDVLVKHLPNSPGLICGAIDRDSFKERAHLFVKNCNGPWTNTNLSAGREYCCKDSLPYKCPSA